jgi:tripartite ATP-independent transporter DctM subunit
MDITVLSILMFGTFFALLALGVPLAWVLSSLGIVFGLIVNGPDVFSIILFRVWGIMESYGLMAIPLFILMANLLRYSGITDELFHAVHLWMGPLRGGLAMATVVVCAILGAMLGTAGAGVIITGLIALPVMLEHKYDKHMALGSIMAGGGLGVLIPPSIMFILYGSFAGESIGKLFIGGIGPGIVLAILFILYIGIKCYFKPKAGPALPKEERDYNFLQLLAMSKSLILPGLLMLGVVGSIFAGVATPGEASGVGAIGALLICLLRRSLSWENLKEALYSTMGTIGIVMWVCFGASIFVGVYTLAGGGEFVKEMLMAMPMGRWGIFIAIQVILLLLGMVIDVIGLVVLCVPIFVPIIKELGFDPLWFGIIFNVSLQLAYLSPPFGYGMFYLKGVTPSHITMNDLYRSVWPFMGMQIIGLVLCIVFPEICVWLPNLLIK